MNDDNDSGQNAHSRSWSPQMQRHSVAAFSIIGAVLGAVCVLVAVVVYDVRQIFALVGVVLLGIALFGIHRLFSRGSLERGLAGQPS
jgi:uncharacterized membrane protein